MNKTTLKTIIKESVKTGWLHFKDESDKKYILDLLKDSDLDDVLTALENCEFEYQDDYDTVHDLRDELDSL